MAGPRPAAAALAAIMAAALTAPNAAPAAASAATLADLASTWPATEAGRGAGERVAFPSRSPFTPAGAADAPAVEARATFFPAADASPAAPAPAVILLHGAGGVSDAREMTYARQYARMGVAALVVDVFGARRGPDTGSFFDRLLNVTESMAVADAYAGLAWLAARGDVDAGRVALVGFSYGGMASLYAARAQMAETFAGDGARFAAHIAYYAPCIARFERPETTGAPILMLLGGADEITDPDRCAATAEDLRAGGSEVELTTFPEAFHQWDGGIGRWRARYGLAACDLVVDGAGRVRDGRTWLPMTGPLSRKIILGLCVDENGYVIGRDDGVRARSNAIVGRFLARVFAGARQG